MSHGRYCVRHSDPAHVVVLAAVVVVTQQAFHLTRIGDAALQGSRPVFIDPNHQRSTHASNLSAPRRRRSCQGFVDRPCDPRQAVNRI